MKTLLKLIVTVLVFNFTACQKDELSTANDITTMDNKSADLKFGFTTKRKTLIAKDHTKKAGLSPRYGHTSVVFDDKMWILGGMRDGMPSNDILYSSDGENWHPIDTKTKFMPRTEHASTVFDGKIWVVGGQFYDPDNHEESQVYYDDEYTELKDVWSSSDGREWELVSSLPFSYGLGLRAYHTLASYDGYLWVIGGSSEHMGDLLCCTYGDVLRSADGIEWDEIYDGTPSAWRITNHSSIGFKDRLWVFGGSSKTGGDGITSSTDGSLWHDSPASSSIRGRSSSGLTYGGELLWFSAGMKTHQHYLNDNEIWYSNNGTHWSEAIPDKEFPARNSHSSVYFKNKLWIINGLGKPPKDIGGLTNKSTENPVPLADIWSFEDPDCCEIGDITSKN